VQQKSFFSNTETLHTKGTFAGGKNGLLGLFWVFSATKTPHEKGSLATNNKGSPRCLLLKEPFTKGNFSPKIQKNLLGLFCWRNPSQKGLFCKNKRVSLVFSASRTFHKKGSFSTKKNNLLSRFCWREPFTKSAVLQKKNSKAIRKCVRLFMCMCTCAVWERAHIHPPHATPLTYICDVTHSNTWHDSSIYVKWRMCV